MVTANELVNKKAMTAAQAAALVTILEGADRPFSRQHALEIMGKADSFEAHRILAYIFNRMMSDAGNREYVIQELGLE